MEEKMNNKETEKVFVTGFKGFDPDMKCRDKRYAENTVFEEDSAEICRRGMHFCENPLDVLDYYSLLASNCNLNEFTTVEALAEAKTEDRKSVTTKLKIGVKLGLKGFVEAAVKISLEWLKKVDFNGGDTAASGYNSQLAASGDNSKLAASGDNCLVEATGKECVIAATGINSKVKGAIGCFIACAEWNRDDNGEWHPISFKAAKVDGKKIKPDTFYMLKNGKFVEVSDGE